MTKKIQTIALAILIAATGIIAAPSVSAQNAEVGFDVIVQWMNIKGLTRYDNVEDFRKDDRITRGESAKFYTAFAELFNLGKTYTNCEFTDIATYDSTLIPSIKDACAYGLIKGSQGKFMPNGNLTEIQAATIIVRAIEGFKDETVTPWYKEYYQSAKALGLITTETMASANTTPITREKLGRWMFTADKTRDIQQAGPKIGVSTQIVSSNGDTRDVSAGIAVEVEYQGGPADNTGSYKNYSDEALNTALSQGKQVVLFFNATWCPLCIALDKDLQKNMDNIPADLVILSIDYDTNEALRRTWNVTSQHTLIYLDNKGAQLYNNVKLEVTLDEIINVIVTNNNADKDYSESTI